MTHYPLAALSMRFGLGNTDVLTPSGKLGCYLEGARYAALEDVSLCQEARLPRLLHDPTGRTRDFTGSADAPAVVSNMPINFPAAFLKALNILTVQTSEVRDPNHDLFRTNVAGKALVFPTCIGSTYTGLVLLELIKNGHAPAIIVVSLADPLLVSGAVLARIWYNLDLPILEVVDRRDLGRIAIGIA